MTSEQILDLPMQANDADALTIRDYLKRLLTTLWEEDEGFSGKKPFGNSGWQGEVYTAMVIGGVTKGMVYRENDEIVDVEYHDTREADKHILEAIQVL